MKFFVIAFLSFALSGSFTQTDTAPSGPVLCALPAPSGFNGTWATPASAHLEWTSVSGASAYRLKIYDETSLVSNTVEYGTSKIIWGLSSNKTYRCELASICGDSTTGSDFIICDIINP